MMSWTSLTRSQKATVKNVIAANAIAMNCDLIVDLPFSSRTTSKARDERSVTTAIAQPREDTA